MHTTFTPRGRQRGAALFMALICLLIMTMLGVFGMNMSRMENLMAGNSQLQMTALNDAERTLSVAEEQVEAILLSPPFVDWNETSDAYYDHTPDSTDPIDAHDLTWSFDYVAVDANNRYVIEYAGPEVITGNDGSIEAAAVCPSANCVWVYLTTAQNESARGAKRTVQSVYVTTTPP